MIRECLTAWLNAPGHKLQAIARRRGLGPLGPFRKQAASLVSFPSQSMQAGTCKSPPVTFAHDHGEHLALSTLALLFVIWFTNVRPSLAKGQQIQSLTSP